MPLRKSKKEQNNKIVKMDKDAKSFFENLLGDISKSSATKQMVMGTGSGWVTGLISMKIGKTMALAIGSGIILLEIANEQGYIKLNWDKVGRNIDKVADKVEEKVTGEGPSWVDKMERYVDRKLDNAEDVLKKRQGKAHKWYSALTGDNGYKLKESHIFIVSFVAGICIGVATS